MEELAKLGPVGAVMFVISVIGFVVVLIKPKFLRDKPTDQYGILFIKTGGLGFVLILISIFHIELVFLLLFLAAAIYMVYGMN